jgi:hypothetical protein
LRLAYLSRLISISLLLVFFFSPTPADTSNEETKNLLPDKVGELRAPTRAETLPADDATSNDYEKEFAIERNYRAAKGAQYAVTLVKSRTDRGAYSLFSSEMQKLLLDAVVLHDVGTMAAVDSSGRLLFYKGFTFVTIANESSVKNSDDLVAFARLLAEPLDKGDGEIPVLIKHLPEWETKQHRTVYATSVKVLQEAVGNRPVLDVLNFAGGAEAVTALYGPSRLVIVELTTPQLATDGDARIIARIAELKAGGQPIPSAYRRVGNYVVFVFDAPDEAGATQLIDKIAYEQVVQWLGNNPNWLIRAEREYRRSTAGAILAVFKASGLSLLICLGIGGIFGSIIFRRRRAQQATSHAYSDAGGMLRLNIDEMTPEVDPSRLLGKGDG